MINANAALATFCTGVRVNAQSKRRQITVKTAIASATTWDGEGAELPFNWLSG